MSVKLICDQCGKEFCRRAGDYNRAKKRTSHIFCSQACFGLSRRKAVKVNDIPGHKAAYDKARRERLGESLRQKKREYYNRVKTENPELVKKWLNAPHRKAYMAEYIKSDAYRKWKAGYDQKYLAKKQYGEFAEAALALRQIEDEVAIRIDNVEIATQNHTLNKSQQRKRNYGINN